MEYGRPLIVIMIDAGWLGCAKGSLDQAQRRSVRMTKADVLAPNRVPCRFLVPELRKSGFRAEYYAGQLKRFLAAQIRALRGDLSQAEFGRRIGKPQSVISRLERQSYGNVNLQTLIDIATKLDIGLIIRFVDLPTFLKWASDYSANVLAPEPYNDGQMEDLLEEEKRPGESNNSPMIGRASFGTQSCLEH
jgi:transcriptional regulator with XRE-family HTH domain